MPSALATEPFDSCATAAQPEMPHTAGSAQAARVAGPLIASAISRPMGK
jgi:hypothetical protein